jgi:hypothetical protein
MAFIYSLVCKNTFSAATAAAESIRGGAHGSTNKYSYAYYHAE